MGSDTQTILDGSTFVVSDRAGDIEASIDMPHGLFHRDTRFLSRWRLTVDGRALDVLSTDAVDYFSAQFFLGAPAVVRYVMGDRLFSGWGIRTMAEGEGGYNPIEYHNGTVWPHDNALIAAGLRRYGYRREAARLAYAILEAATYFEHRLPEVFAGYPRGLTHFPVQYPTASSPQAWASGTPLLLVRVILGLEPTSDELITDPLLPDGIGELELRNVHWRGRRKTV